MMANQLRSGCNALLVTLSVLLGACNERQADDKWLASARTYLEHGEPKAAAIQLKNLLQNNPESAEGRFLLGKSLSQTGDLAGAEIELDRALRLQHPQAAVLPLIAELMTVRRDFRAVTQRFAKVDLDDTAADAQLKSLIALAFSAQQMHEHARATIARAVALEPRSSRVMLANAQVKAAAKDVDGALSVLDQILDIVPKDCLAWQFKGFLLFNGREDKSAAISAYEHALALCPNDARLHATVLSLYLTKGDVKAAKQQLEAFRRTNSKDSLTSYFDAQIALAEADYRRARELVKALLQSEPNSASALQLAGAIELKLDEASRAEAYLTQAVQLQPHSMGARVLLAQAYLHESRPAKAIAELRPLVDRPDADADILLLAGRAYLMADDFKLADAMFKRVARTRPGDGVARTFSAMSQLRQGGASAALNELQAIAASDSGIDADLAIISASMQRGDFDAALRAISSFERKQPNHPLGPDLRGRVQLLRKDLVAARKSFERAVALKPDYVFAVVKLGAVDLIENKPAQAEERIKHLLELDPKSVQGWLALADLKRRGGGTPEEVVNVMIEAVKANPWDAEPQMALIAYHMARGDTDAGLAAAHAAVAAIPQSAELLDQLARVSMARSDLNVAATTFGKIVSQQADSPLGFQGLAEISVATKDYAAAARHAKKALELAPTSLAAQQISIIAAMNLKRPKDALAIAKIIQAQNPGDALGLIWEGDIHASDKRWDLAVDAFRLAMAKSQPAQAPMKFHDALVCGNRQSEASRFAVGWADAHPTDLVFLAYLAELASSQRDWARAENYYRQMLKIQPDNVLAINNMAWLLTNQRRPGALKLALRALEVAPDQVGIMDTLAMAYSLNNQHARAMQLQKKVLEMSPEVPLFHLTMAKIYIQAGEKSLARAELEALTKRNRKFPGSEEIAVLLNSLT